MPHYVRGFIRIVAGNINSFKAELLRKYEELLKDNEV
jgi:hypothetical protein